MKFYETKKKVSQPTNRKASPGFIVLSDGLLGFGSLTLLINFGWDLNFDTH